MIAAALPKMMNGMRFPIFVFVRSERVPKKGSRNRASTLSAPMMTPASVSFMWKVCLRISGTTLSYICQNAQMDRNASPTSMVRLLLSFMGFLLSLELVYSFPALKSARTAAMSSYM